MILEEIPSVKEITLKAANREGHLIRATELGLYEFRAHSPRRVCRLADNGIERVLFRLMKAQIVHGKYSFVVRLKGDGLLPTEMSIDGRKQLEQLMRVLGSWTTLNGLHEMMVEFKKIGEGSFAQVYEAVTHYKHKMALKCFQKRNLFSCDKSQMAFKNEINMMKMCNSRHIVSYHYTFQTEKVYYIKMEYFQQNLKSLLSLKMLVSKQKQLMRHLLLGLAQLKRRNVVHRDLKPDNIMIRKTAEGEEAVIIDMGLATHVDAIPYIFTRCGTPGFLAPQIANLNSKNEKQECAADMYSLGCIFYKMITKKYLFQGHSAKEVLRNNRKCIYDQNCFNQLSQYQNDLLLKMLEPDPLRRISPSQALKHPYFQTDIDDGDQIPEEECPVSQQLRKINQQPATYKNMSGVYSLSGMETVANSQKGFTAMMKRKSGLDDSCLSFEGPQKLLKNLPSRKSAKFRNSSNDKCSLAPTNTAPQSRFSMA